MTGSHSRSHVRQAEALKHFANGVMHTLCISVTWSVDGWVLVLQIGRIKRTDSRVRAKYQDFIREQKGNQAPKEGGVPREGSQRVSVL